MTKYNILRKKYTLNDSNYQLKLPLELDAMIPEDDCVRLISQFVEEMDLTALYATYDRLPPENHPSPSVMLKLLLYAYHEGAGAATSRHIEDRCRRDINYMYLLEGCRAPDHATIARFRSVHFAKIPLEMLSCMVRMLMDLGQVTDEELFIDGTKIEADANRYTFVWKKSLTRNQAKFLQKTALLVGDIIARYGMEPLRNRQVKKKHVKKVLGKLKASVREEGIGFVHGRGSRKTQIQRDIEDLEESLEKIKGYEEKLHACGTRNSYSKTDRDATFMHMKDDHMKNGQLKPAYNLQHAVNSGFIVMSQVFQKPGDTLTLIPFLDTIEQKLGMKIKRIVADAGYESEENRAACERRGIDAHIKPANYEQVGTKKFTADISRRENMKYVEETDSYICENGKEVRRTREYTLKTSTGYERKMTEYHCSECDGCPYRKACMPGRNWKKPLEERYKTMAVSKEMDRMRAAEYDTIDTDEGKMLRMNRSIQVEGSFADMKGDCGMTRFLCRGMENVLAESVLYAMAHNLGWLHSRIQNDKLDLHLYALKEPA